MNERLTQTWTLRRIYFVPDTLLPISVVAAVALVIAFLFSARKRRMTGPSPSPEQGPIEDKKSLLTPPLLADEPNQYLHSLKEETHQQDLVPIYPWIAPPQRLPGPYDAPYYPLPIPTIRKYPLDLSTESSGGTTEELAEETSEENIPDESTIVSSTRRIPIRSISNDDVIIEHTTTTSSHGWRRTHWNVPAS